MEIRNHWRRDVLMGEDGSRSRNPNLLANLAIIRSALLCVLADQFEGKPHPEIRECLHGDTDRCRKILNAL